MVGTTHVRVCTDFERWLKDQQARTGLNNPAITKILVSKLQGVNITHGRKDKRIKPITVRKLLDTPVEDIFKWF